MCQHLVFLRWVLFYETTGQFIGMHVHSSRGLGGGEACTKFMMCAAPPAPLRVEPEPPLDEGTEWITSRWTELVGLMHLQTAESRTSGLADSRTFTDSWNTLFFADTLLRVRESVSPQAILGRIGELLSILSYITSL